MGTEAREIKQAPQADGDGDDPFVADQANYLSAVSGGPPALHGGGGSEPNNGWGLLHFAASRFCLHAIVARRYIALVHAASASGSRVDAALSTCFLSFHHRRVITTVFAVVEVTATVSGTRLVDLPEYTHMQCPSVRRCITYPVRTLACKCRLDRKALVIGMASRSGYYSGRGHADACTELHPDGAGTCSSRRQSFKPPEMGRVGRAGRARRRRRKRNGADPGREKSLNLSHLGIGTSNVMSHRPERMAGREAQGS
ncbi:hypothetical protein V8C26DRAFT_316819 [Trichoderma gracile]